MTAMVDVAFLLLTFFILTTTLATPQAMPLVIPPEGGTTNVAAEKVLTLILGKGDQIHYYDNLFEPDLRTTDYSADGLRQVVNAHLNKHANRCTETENLAGCWDPIIVIKPAEGSRYKNMVDALDEMRISSVPKYALYKVMPEDSLLLVDAGL